MPVETVERVDREIPTESSRSMERARAQFTILERRRDCTPLAVTGPSKRHMLRLLSTSCPLRHGNPLVCSSLTFTLLLNNTWAGSSKPSFPRNPS